MKLSIYPTRGSIPRPTHLATEETHIVSHCCGSVKIFKCVAMPFRDGKRNGSNVKTLNGSNDKTLNCSNDKTLKGSNVKTLNGSNDKTLNGSNDRFGLGLDQLVSLNFFFYGGKILPHRFFLNLTNCNGGECIYARLSNFPRDCDFQGTQVNTEKSFCTAKRAHFKISKHSRNLSISTKTIVFNITVCIFETLSFVFFKL
jgi:hypothetical protein